ncbi:MAG: hypothetical protein UDQ15_03965 [Ruminococcus sp.]|nr:hypothetical protein [Ruminococcus sp.]
MIVSSKVALQNHSIVRVQTVAEWQSLFSFAYFSFFSKKKPNEKENSTLSLPNGKFFFLLPAFFFNKKKPDEKDDFMLSLLNGNLFFLLPTFLFSAKRNQMKKMIPRFPCRTANSFFFCLLFFF